MRLGSGSALSLLSVALLACVQPQVLRLPEPPAGAKTRVLVSAHGQYAQRLDPGASADEQALGAAIDGDEVLYLLYYRCRPELLGLSSGDPGAIIGTRDAPPTRALFVRTPESNDFELYDPASGRPPPQIQLQLFPAGCAKISSQTLYGERVGYFFGAYQVNWIDRARRLFAASAGADEVEEGVPSEVLLFGLDAQDHVQGPCPLTAPGLLPLAVAVQSDGETLWVLAQFLGSGDFTLARGRVSDVVSCTSSAASPLSNLVEVALAADPVLLRGRLGLTITEGSSPEICIHSFQSSVYCHPSGLSFVASSTPTFNLRIGLVPNGPGALIGFGVCDAPTIPEGDDYFGCAQLLHIDGTGRRFEPVPDLDGRELITQVGRGPDHLYVGTSRGALLSRPAAGGGWTTLEGRGDGGALVDGVGELPTGLLISIEDGGDSSLGRPGCETIPLASSIEGILIDGERALVLSQDTRVQTLTAVQLEDPGSCSIDAP